MKSSSEADSSELLKILKKCFLGTTYVVILSTGSNLQPHISVYTRRGIEEITVWTCHEALASNSEAKTLIMIINDHQSK